MACRGVHFAIKKEQKEKLFLANDDEQILSVIEEIVEESDEQFLQETDKSWDAIHRCLSDGTLKFEAGFYPLNMVILGGFQMYEGNDYIVSFKDEREVDHTDKRIRKIDKSWLRERYFKLNPEEYGFELSEEEFEYIWGYFELLKKFYKTASNHNRAVIFTVG